MIDFDSYAFLTVIPVAAENSEWLAGWQSAVSQAMVWVQMKYADAPALVFGAGVALALPLLAAMGFVFQLFGRNDEPAVMQRDDANRTLPPSIWRQSAWFELPDHNMPRYQIGQEIVRIGRESDNDLCLCDPTVHRYHAVLEQTADAEFIISYVGDPNGDGLLINGQAMRRQRLRGGEVLGIGAIKLRFALGAA
jgi:hypothetical protein